MRVKFFTALLAISSIGLGYPLEPLDGQNDSTDPCKQVGDEVAKWIQENNIVPKELAMYEDMFRPAIPAAPIQPSLAFACLKSIPLDAKAGLQQLDFIRPLFEWQSTLDYLKEVPKGYLSQGVDLIGGLDDIATKLRAENGGYSNEWEFLADLYTLTGIRVRDYHFSYSTALFDLFTFRMEVEFLSISHDGVSVPDIYLYGDLRHLEEGYNPSPVVKIDGVPALEFLQRASLYNGGPHDPDARLNQLFPSPSADTGLTRDSAEPFILDLKDITTVECQNGTVLEFHNTAYVRGNFSGITSGIDLYETFGLSKSNATLPLAWGLYELDRINYTADLSRYPEPVGATSDSIILGFLPAGEVLEDVAVLSVSSFADVLTPDILTNYKMEGRAQQFCDVIVNTIRQAKESRRSKLILDLQANGGGMMTNLATLYFSLFPGKILPAKCSSRAHPQLEWLGHELEREEGQKGTQDLPLALNTFQDLDGSDWKDFQAFFGPVEGQVGNYTHGSLYDISRALNYGTFVFEQPFSEPPYQPEDIIIITDGVCGSACAIFVDILTHEHGIRTVAIGGRPTEAPMQAIGATKGGPVASFVSFSKFNRSNIPAGLDFVPDHDPPLRIPGLTNWREGVSINVANIVPLNAPDVALPLQMTYEAAHCKLFFTWEMMKDMTVLWNIVVGVAWGGERCVKGSTSNADGTVGEAPGYTVDVEDKYRLENGPGSVG